MNRNISYVLVIISIFFGVISVKADTIPEAFRLSAVKFIGVKHVNKKELARTLAAKTPDKWRFWKSKPVLNRTDLDEDLLRIKQFYQRKGYYHASAVFAVVQTDKTPPPAVRVIFTITEGPPVIVQAIEIKPETEIKGISTQDLATVFPLKIGNTFDTDLYNEGKKKLSKAYGNKGRPFAKVTGRVLVSKDENTASMALKIEPGKPYRFGKLKITENQGYVKDIVIVRAIRFNEGDLYSTDKVEQSQRNLYNLDMFRAALIKPGAPVPESDAVPMEVLVKPKKRQSVKFGVGFGNEDGLRLSGAWTYRNLLGRAGKFSVNARRSEILQTIFGNYQQPYVFDHKTNLKSNAGYQRDRLDSYNSQKIFGNATFVRQFKHRWSGRIGYNLELSELQDLKVIDPEDIALAREENEFLISSIKLGADRNTANDDFNPTGGSSVSLSFEEASQVFGSELTFFQPAVELKKYYSLPKNLVLAGRFRFEAIQETEDTDTIPIFKRLFSGGPNTVRGYSFQKLGPLDPNGNPLGGQTSLIGNLELRYPIYKKLGGVTFLDMGHVNRDPFGIDTDDIRFTCGLGLRYNTIIGPIRFDVGYKINPPSLGDVADTTTPDEKTEDRWQFHISIGQTF